MVCNTHKLLLSLSATLLLLARLPPSLILLPTIKVCALSILVSFFRRSSQEVGDPVAQSVDGFLLEPEVGQASSFPPPTPISALPRSQHTPIPLKDPTPSIIRLPTRRFARPSTLPRPQRSASPRPLRHRLRTWLECFHDRLAVRRGQWDFEAQLEREAADLRKRREEFVRKWGDMRRARRTGRRAPELGQGASYTLAASGQGVKSSSGFQIFVDLFSSEVIVVDGVQSSDTVLSLKQKIEDRSEVPIDSQRLRYNFRECEDLNPISEYDISSGSTLRLLVRLRGGAGDGGGGAGTSKKARSSGKERSSTASSLTATPLLPTTPSSSTTGGRPSAFTNLPLEIEMKIYSYLPYPDLLTLHFLSPSFQIRLAKPVYQPLHLRAVIDFHSTTHTFDKRTTLTYLLRIFRFHDLERRRVAGLVAWRNEWVEQKADEAAAQAFEAKIAAEKAEKKVAKQREKKAKKDEEAREAQARRANPRSAPDIDPFLGKAVSSEKHRQTLRAIMENVRHARIPLDGLCAHLRNELLDSDLEFDPAALEGDFLDLAPLLAELEPFLDVEDALGHRSSSTLHTVLLAVAACPLPGSTDHLMDRNPDGTWRINQNTTGALHLIADLVKEFTPRNPILTLLMDTFYRCTGKLKHKLYREKHGGKDTTTWLLAPPELLDVAESIMMGIIYSLFATGFEVKYVLPACRDAQAVFGCADEQHGVKKLNLRPNDLVVSLPPFDTVSDLLAFLSVHLTLLSRTTHRDLHLAITTGLACILAYLVTISSNGNGEASVDAVGEMYTRIRAGTANNVSKVQGGAASWGDVWVRLSLQETTPLLEIGRRAREVYRIQSNGGSWTGVTSGEPQPNLKGRRGELLSEYCRRWIEQKEGIPVLFGSFNEPRRNYLVLSGAVPASTSRFTPLHMPDILSIIQTFTASKQHETKRLIASTKGHRYGLSGALFTLLYESSGSGGYKKPITTDSARFICASVLPSASYEEVFITTGSRNKGFATILDAIQQAAGRNALLSAQNEPLRVLHSSNKDLRRCHKKVLRLIYQKARLQLQVLSLPDDSLIVYKAAEVFEHHIARAWGSRWHYGKVQDGLHEDTEAQMRMQGVIGLLQRGVWAFQKL